MNVYASILLKKVSDPSRFSLVCRHGDFFPDARHSGRSVHRRPGDPRRGARLPLRLLRPRSTPLGPVYQIFERASSRAISGLSIVYQGRHRQPVHRRRASPSRPSSGSRPSSSPIPSGILLGTWAAMKRGRVARHAAMAISTLGVSVPNFVLSSLLQYIFCVKLHLLPVARWGSFEHTILPTLALAALPTAFIARLTRSNMVEVLQQDYIRTALRKGFPFSRSRSGTDFATPFFRSSPISAPSRPRF